MTKFATGRRMTAIIIGTILAAIVAGLARRWRGPSAEEPMLPEPDTDWTD